MERFFDPHAALDHLQAVRPTDYARTRNHLQGAVTGLSPYITHGVLTLPQVAEHLRQVHQIDPAHKLMYELGWRAYFQHVWRHEGDGIFRSLHAGVLPDEAYAPEVPADLREARTGLAVIDQAVRTLYRTGYLHNHARLWLASYTVHLRKVHWRAGADWLYGHLLDGDLASNHLSWQWVAGTGSHKPYLFNAENVARFAPPDWHVTGGWLDTDHDTLLAWASQREPVAPAVDAAERRTGQTGHTTSTHAPEPPLLSTPPFPLRTAQQDDLAGAWLVHPWSLRAADDLAVQRTSTRSGRRIGVLLAPFHHTWPWSAQRWHFVHALMQPLCDEIVWLEAPPPDTSCCINNPHLHAALPGWPDAALSADAVLWPDPGQRCRSFSRYWQVVNNESVPRRAHQ